MFVSFLTELFVGHEAGTALELSGFFEVVAVVEEGVLEVDGEGVEVLAGYRRRQMFFLQSGEVQLVGGEVVFEFGNEGLVVALLVHS